MKKRIILILTTLMFLTKGISQDLHFSQYFNTPLLVNPANTGFNPSFDYRVGGNYRNQWQSVSNFPYKTMSAWFDAQLFYNKFENGWMGIGGAILQDEAGRGMLKSTKAYASVAYHQLLGLNSLLSGGFNIGFTQKNIDITKLTFSNQWNGTFFDGSLNANEPFAYSSVSYFTLQVGINYANFVSDNAYFNVGFSIMNVNRPNETFYKTNTDNTHIPERYTAFANASFKIKDLWILNPNAYYSRMSSTDELVFGATLQRDLSIEHDGTLQLIAGGYYRKKDAIIPMIGFTVKNLTITVNYDVTTSSLKDYIQSRGAYELSIVKNGLFQNKEKDIKCPRTVKF